MAQPGTAVAPARLRRIGAPSSDIRHPELFSKPLDLVRDPHEVRLELSDPTPEQGGPYGVELELEQ